MSLAAIITGNATHLVGIERFTDGRPTRAYVSARWRGIYFDDPPEAVEACVEAWIHSTGHVLLDRRELAYTNLRRELDDWGQESHA